MKKINDYIHLYLGCDIFLSGNRVKLDTEGLNHMQYYDTYSVTKLILRRISDITEDELKQCAGWSGICSPSDWNAITNDKTTVRHKKCDATFHISDSGDCIFKNSGNWRDFGVSSQQSRIFKQLLTWGFDLFGLISSGLAVDGKILNANLNLNQK